jgi:hypothetical protein
MLHSLGLFETRFPKETVDHGHEKSDGPEHQTARSKLNNLSARTGIEDLGGVRRVLDQSAEMNLTALFQKKFESCAE